MTCHLMLSRPRLREESHGPSVDVGFSLIEVLAAAAILVVGFVAIMGIFGNTLGVAGQSREQAIAGDLIQEKVEWLKGKGLDALLNENILQYNVPGNRDSGFVPITDQVTRSHITYTRRVEAWWVEGSVPSYTLVKFKVSVSWKGSSGDVQEVTVYTVLGKRGK